MTLEQKASIKKQINDMIYALENARNLDEAWEIEEGIIELENMLYGKKGEEIWFTM